jgi:hypothetical protein
VNTAESRLTAKQRIASVGVLLTVSIAGCSSAFAGTGNEVNPKPALSIEDVNIAALKLPADCKLIEKESFVSNQAHMLYATTNAPTIIKVLKPPLRQSLQSIQCGKSAGTIYYYEYSGLTDANQARGFAEGLIWGGPSPTPMHPELILGQDNMLVVISAHEPETLRKLVRIENMPRMQLTPLSGEQDVGAGVLINFPKSLKVVSSTMPHGATNFRAYGSGLKVGITGIPTGKPRAEPDFVAGAVNDATRQYGHPSHPFPAAQTMKSQKVNAAYSAQCSDGEKYPIFPDASFACSTVLIISADEMVLVVSIGADSLELDDYKAIMAALLAAH